MQQIIKLQLRHLWQYSQIRQQDEHHYENRNLVNPITTSDSKQRLICRCGYTDGFRRYITS